MYELLSKRIKNADRDNRKCLHIIVFHKLLEIMFLYFRRCLEPYLTYNENFWDIFEEKFCREKGLKGMGYGKLQNGYGKSSIEKYFKDCDDIDFLDAIDYFFT